MKMCRRIHLLVAIVLLATPSAAQPTDFDLSRFSPFEVGNYWEYETHDRRTGNNAYATSAYVSFEVLPDISIEGVIHRVIRGRSYTGNGTEIGSTDCAFPFTEEGAMADEGILVSQEGPGQAHCFRPVIALWSETQLQGIEENTTVEVGSAVHSVHAVGTYGYEDGDAEVGGDGMQLRASDIGLIFHQNRLWNQEQSGTGTQTYTVTFTARLLRAELTTGNFGNTGVASEPSDQPGRLALTLTAVYPNPSSRVLNVEASGVASGPASIELFDVSGKRVYVDVQTSSDGSLHHRLSLPAGPAGVFFVRVSDASGRVAISSFVRVPEAE